MREDKSREKISKMTIEERLVVAKEKTDKLVDHTLALIALHENNALVTYSSLLTDQIPKSYAANAFDTVQKSLYFFEIVRLCSLWDRLDLDKYSISTVLALFEDEGIFDLIRAEDDYEPIYLEEPLRSSQHKNNKDRAESRVETLKNAIRLAKMIVGSLRLKRTRELRDNFLAHNIDQKEKKNVVPMKYGDEKDLLMDTIKVMDWLHIGINGAGHTWDQSKEMAKRNAGFLWGNCTFDIKRGN